MVVRYTHIAITAKWGEILKIFIITNKRNFGLISLQILETVVQTQVVSNVNWDGILWILIITDTLRSLTGTDTTSRRRSFFIGVLSGGTSCILPGSGVSHIKI
ncbi:uncharacterized protein EV154DRAFT_488395 [Mucor mucedo]|uniref:uncharacterized protein n=1 Tax=Mucor mucedo TaxID=29922 RepID=UPI0022202E9F|nr:uncharacterized protein EV154DRAFT_488395 [Mucor mucedo]KAI7867212.1 hypothetical protein EV154DRAFT_488395 [Mucor mucedo]